MDPDLSRLRWCPSRHPGLVAALVGGDEKGIRFCRPEMMCLTGAKEWIVGLPSSVLALPRLCGQSRPLYVGGTSEVDWLAKMLEYGGKMLNCTKERRTENISSYVIKRRGGCHITQEAR